MDDDARRLEREARRGDPQAQAHLAAARARALRRPDGTRAHTGEWRYHDDDCWCGAYGHHCNRDGHVWSCCGSCKEDSECSGAKLHPTSWKHAQHGETVAGHEGPRPTYRSDAEIRAAAPEAFQPDDPERP